MGFVDQRLANSALLVAQSEYPNLSIAKYLKKLDVMGTEVRERIHPKLPPSEQVNTVIHYLFTEKRFQGNSLDSHDPRNSFLNEVIDRKVGLPVTLVILAIDILEQVGLKSWALGLPNHVLLGVDVEGGRQMLIDAFHGGIVLTKNEVKARVRSEQWNHHMVMGNRAILTRLLNNLKVIYWSEKRFDKALPVMERLIELNPEDLVEIRDRGLAYHQMKHYSRALVDLEQYLLGLQMDIPHEQQQEPSDASLRVGDEVMFVQDLVQWLRGQVSPSRVLH